MLMKRILIFLSLFFVLVSCENEMEEMGEEEEQEEEEIQPFTADSLQINQIQIIGSHNSYRMRTYQPILDFALNFTNLLPASLNPEGWDYDHIPLPDQFTDYGIRQIEIDIYYDPDGGRFADRGGNTLVGEPVESGIPDLDEPGFKVLHIADMDYMTHYFTFKQALEAVKTWSEANPQHLPIFILIETKSTNLGIPGFAEVLDFDKTAMDAVDQEIKGVFGEDLDQVITPDDVRGEWPTLNEAIKTIGWPVIAESRGKVIFLLDNPGSEKDHYLDGHPSLSGRILFVHAATDNPESAFIKSNSPYDQNIEQWVTEGYIVRTRADTDTEEARSGDGSRRDRAFASGAQLISTDYYRPDPRHSTSSDWTDYSVSFGQGKVALVNPISGPVGFATDKIE